MTIDELHTYIFDGQPNALADQFAGWLTTSVRFRAFATVYRDKIRKKIRGARDAEGRRDLQIEFATAYLLLQERYFSVEYEKYGTGKARGPDFTVTFRSRTIFNLEVTRMRGAVLERRTQIAVQEFDQDGAAPAAPGKQYEVAKLADTVCGKLGQMLAGMINIVMVIPDDDSIDGDDIARAMARLRERAERKDGAFFSRYGFRDASDFFKHYQRLSGVLVRSTWAGATGSGALLWTNPQARHAIPTDIRTILKR